MAQTLERKIHFYKMKCKKGVSRVLSLQILDEVNGLAFKEGRGGRYLPKSDGDLWTMLVDSTTARPRGRLGTIRRNSLPLIEGQGRTSPLRLPPNSQGLFEPSHFVIFAKDVIGVEFNYYGPRIAVLKAYLPVVAGSLVDEVELLPLLSRDVHKTMAEIGEITLFKLRVYRSIRDELRYLDIALHDAFDSLKDASDADSVEIVFRTERWAREPLEIPFREKIAGWLSKPGVKENVSSFKLRARNIESGNMQEVDLMQSFILSTQQVVKQDDRHRSVNTQAMFGAIEKAYSEKADDINEAIAKEPRTNE